MAPRITEIDVPAASCLAPEVARSYFHDSYEMAVDTRGRSAMALALQTLTRAPPWIERLMALRNRVVALVGLKDLGAMSRVDTAKAPEAYRPGDRAGIFTVLHVADDEVVLGDSDRHLDVKVSVRKTAEGAQGRVAVSTVVHVHNTLGRVYMLFVAPVHRRIAPAMLRRAAG